MIEGKNVDCLSDCQSGHHTFDPQNVFRLPGQITIIPKPELRGFWGSSLIKPPFRVTSADVVIICPDLPSVKLTASLHLKMDGWKTILSFWEAYFQGRKC